METTLTGIDPIPVEYILRIAQSKATEAQRRPYVTLIKRWGEERGCLDEACLLLKQLRGGQELDPKDMPSDFMPRYRQPEVAEKLITIIREIDATIASKKESWKWANVKRVMEDEGIIRKITDNRFDELICSMVPGKGRDIVRKNGNYAYIKKQEESWHFWTTVSHINPTLYGERVICNQIALLFAPILTRTIRVEF